MMKFFYASLVAVLLSGCLKDDLDVTEKVVGGDLHYLGSNQDYDDLPNDSYRIIGVTPSDEYWNVIVEYTGGCEEHDFVVFWEGEWDENPVEGVFYLLHDSNGETCESVVRDTLQVDLEKVFYEDAPDELEQLSVVNGSNSRQIKVPVDLMELTQSENCEVEALIRLVDCSYGIWDDRWLLMQDWLGQYEKVWLQPIKNSESVSLDVPAIGPYKVGVTALFGFQYTSDSVVTCQSYPEGEIIPVAINCMALLDN